METGKVKKTTKVVAKTKSNVEVKKDKEVIEKKVINEEKVNANFSRRLAAYIIDMLIISVLLTIFGLVIPSGDRIKELEKETRTITTQYMDKKIDAKTFNEKINPINYDIAKETFISSIISIVVTILYFVLFQFKYKATLGKRVMGIVIIKDKGDITINDLIYRSLMIHSVFSSFITLLILFILNKNSYSAVSSFIYMAQFSFLIVTISYIMFRKDRLGLHDIITKTRVVEV